MSVYRMSYFFREAFKNIRGSLLMTSISILTIAVSLILVGFFGGLLIVAQGLIDRVTEDIQISAYLEQTITDTEAETLRSEIQAKPEVERVTYIKLDDDRRRNWEMLPPDLREGLDINKDPDSVPATPTLEIVLEKERRLRRDVDHVATWVGKMDRVVGVSDIEIGMDKIRLGLVIVDVFDSVAWIICVVLIIAAIFFVFSTIKMAVHSRAEEIDILRLVGATGRFIRMPFYLEGLFSGFMGSLIAFGVIAYMHNRLNHYIREEHLLDVDINLLPAPLVLWFFAGGTLLGFLGSIFSVGRYLRG